MVRFRKRFGKKRLNEVNETICKQGRKDDDEPPAARDSKGCENPIEIKNRGKLIMDATCAPADIRYPTDLSLLNEARGKTEMFINILYEPLKGEIDKPRTYRRIARADYLATAKKMRRPRKKQLRRALRKQLGYLRRNLVSIGRLKEYHRESPHTDSHELTLETIRELYHQQKYMYDHKTQSVPNRIVSISQPHVRPIVRGKAEPTLSSALSWPSAL